MRSLGSLGIEWFAKGGLIRVRKSGGNCLPVFVFFFHSASRKAHRVSPAKRSVISTWFSFDSLRNINRMKILPLRQLKILLRTCFCPKFRFQLQKVPSQIVIFYCTAGSCTYNLFTSHHYHLLWLFSNRFGCMHLTGN